MIIIMSKNKLINIVMHQLKNVIYFNKFKENTLLKKGVNIALEKIEYCFSFSRNKYFFKNNNVFFNPFHSGQYTIFLYYLSNVIFKIYNNDYLADRIYYLNKTLNSIDLFYEIELPDIFMLDHPVGSVMGRAKYSNFFTFVQNCTVGQNKGIYPTIGKNVTLFLGVTIIGNSKIGENCFISAKTYIKDQDIPCNSIVFGTSPNLIIKNKDDSYFKIAWNIKNENILKNFKI